MFSPIQNNKHINSFNRTITIAQKANTNFTLYIGSQTILNYLAKYYTKEKKKSIIYLDLVK